MDLIIPRRSSYCPNFATAPSSESGGQASVLSVADKAITSDGLGKRG
ncbi:hypothetical protein [Corynebacterium macclintockiae]